MNFKWKIESVTLTFIIIKKMKWFDALHGAIQSSASSHIKHRNHLDF
jgi:hypothetical protein